DPLTAVILIDTSLSMNDKFQKVRKIEMAKKGALLLLNQMKSRDKMLVIRFSDVPSATTSFLSDKKRIKEALQALKGDNGYTALLDAIYLARQTVKQQSGQKLIFICSDGEDTASKHSTDEILDGLKSDFDLTVI